MSKVFQILIIAVFLGVFAVPSFASVQVANINKVAVVDDEPKKKETTETEKKSTENKEAETKDESAKSSETKSCCKKENTSCEKK